MTRKIEIRNKIWGLVLYLVCYFGGFTPALIMIGVSAYFKVVKKSQYNVKAVLRAFIIPLTFYLVREVIMLIPDIAGVIVGIIGVFELQDAYTTIVAIFSTFTSIASILEAIIVITIAISDFLDLDFRIPIFDTVIDCVYQKLFTKEEIRELAEIDEEDILKDVEEKDNTESNEEDALDRIFKLP